MDEFIRNENQLKEILGKRKENAEKRIVNEEATQADHTDVANQLIKVINMLNLDSFVKSVMSKRILGPLLTGEEASHTSIALELGANVHDVRQAEAYGRAIVGEMVETMSIPEEVEKFNRDRNAAKIIENELNKQRKSS